MIEALYATYKIGDVEVMDLWEHGKNDWSVFFHNADCSVRGTLLDVIQEISRAFDVNEIVEV